MDYWGFLSLLLVPACLLSMWERDIVDQLDMRIMNKMEELTKAEFLADFFCSNLAKEVYKSLSHLDNYDDVVSSLTHFGEKLWFQIEQNQEESGDDTDY